MRRCATCSPICKGTGLRPRVLPNLGIKSRFPPHSQPLSPEGRGASSAPLSPRGEGLLLLPSPLGGEGLGVRGGPLPQETLTFPTDLLPGVFFFLLIQQLLLALQSPAVASQATVAEDDP